MALSNQMLDEIVPHSNTIYNRPASTTSHHGFKK